MSNERKLFASLRRAKNVTLGILALVAEAQIVPTYDRALHNSQLENLSLTIAAATLMVTGISFLRSAWNSTQIKVSEDASANFRKWAIHIANPRNISLN